MKKKIFYGWWVTIAAFFTFGFAVGLPYYNISFFYDYFERAFGWSKADIRQYLYDNLWIAADDAERYAYYIGLTGFRLRDHVAKGLLPPEYCASDDPKRRVRMLLNPESIGIVIAGDAGRNQSKCYCSNHTQGPPVSRRVTLPRDWDELLPRR